MTDCELYGHPNVTGLGCPCGRIVRAAPPAQLPPIAVFEAALPLPPVLAAIRGDAPPRERPKALIRTRRSSLRRPEVWC